MGRLPTRRKLFNVVGEDHGNEPASSLEYELLNCTPGEPVSLQRELDNPHDANTIAALSVRGVHIGYVSREHAAILAPAIDEGLPYSAILHELHGLFGESAYHARIEVAWHGAEFG